MTKSVTVSKKPRKQHSPEFRREALKLAERIGVAAAARELSLYESQLYAWRSNYVRKTHCKPEKIPTIITYPDWQAKSVALFSAVI